MLLLITTHFFVLLTLSLSQRLGQSPLYGQVQQFGQYSQTGQSQRFDPFQVFGGQTLRFGGQTLRFEQPQKIGLIQQFTLSHPVGQNLQFGQAQQAGQSQRVPFQQFVQIQPTGQSQRFPQTQQTPTVQQSQQFRPVQQTGQFPAFQQTGPAQQVTQSQPAPQACGSGQGNQFQSAVHVPRRFVPSPPIDRELRRQFFLLFHRDGNTNHTHGSPQDASTAESSQPPPIDPAIIAQINELCSRSAFFYSFAPRHMNATSLLQQVFMNQTDARTLWQLARNELYRHEINSRVWYYALLGTTLMRPDLNGYYLAWALDATPDLYLTARVINQATEGSTRPQVVPPRGVCEEADQNQVVTSFRKRREERTSSRRSTPKVTPRNKRQAIYRDNRGRSCVVYNGTSGASGAENLLWYFREDVMVNQHHWYWHQYYPQMSVRHADRRGEAFYFMHHNLIARYNAERLSNGLGLETSLDLRLDGNIGSGYDSDLVDKQSERRWTPRRANTLLSNINHLTDPDFQLNVTMNEITNLYNTLVSHIQQGRLLANRSRRAGEPPIEFVLDIRNQEGLSHLGNTVEAAEELSTHANFYHTYGVHNLGHIAVALSTDPDYTCQRPTGVMADLTVTMRDPAFYKVHSFTDDLFEHYKRTLAPYQLNNGDWPLAWSGVQVSSLELLVGGWKNYVKTFWSMGRFPLEEGIDGTIHEGDINTEICHQHLNHEPFTFRLVVDVNDCVQSRSSRGTVRIFMAPRYDLNGRRFSMTETRRMMLQLDAFPVDLRLGRNVITRNSEDSSATKPWSRSLQQQLRDPDNGGNTEFCGCGWPDHLYIPKGNPQGMEFDLFAMVTNYDQDQVQNTPEDLRIPEPCQSPYLFCGIPYRRYPDARPMGYPFDRLPYNVLEGGSIVRPVADLEEYVSNVPNMRSAVVVIKHIDTIVG